MESWGRIREPTIELLLKALGCEKNAAGKVASVVFPRIRPQSAGGYAPEVERWMCENGIAGLGKNGTVDVISITNGQIADEAFGGDTKQARRGLEKLCEAGALVRVRVGLKGKPSMYVVGGSFEEQGVGFRGRSAPELPQDSGADDAGFRGSNPLIWGQLDSLTWGSPPYPEYIQSKSREEAVETVEKDEVRCPKCGAPAKLFAVNSSMVECPNCDKAIKLRGKKTSTDRQRMATPYPGYAKPE